MLPLAELGVAAVARTLHLALGVEQSVLVELDLALGVLPAEDAAALSTVVTAIEEAKGGLASRCTADVGGAVRLKKRVSTETQPNGKTKTA